MGEPSSPPRPPAPRPASGQAPSPKTASMPASPPTHAHHRLDLLVIGCGNPLRGDDGAGPECVRRLVGRGLPAGVAAIDAGTGGVDVVLRMREASRVILVDACHSGRPAGAVVALSSTDLDRLPPSGRLDTHGFRWSDALALARALAAGAMPACSARLVEGAAFEPASGLSPAVDRGVDRLVDLLHAEILATFGPTPVAGCPGG